MSNPIVAVVWPERSELARWLRRKPSSATAASTRCATSGWTCGALFTTRETVFRLTPARAATSTMVGRLVRPESLLTRKPYRPGAR